MQLIDYYKHQHFIYDEKDSFDSFAAECIASEYPLVRFLDFKKCLLMELPWRAYDIGQNNWYNDFD